MDAGFSDGTLDDALNVMSEARQLDGKSAEEGLEEVLERRVSDSKGDVTGISVVHRGEPMWESDERWLEQLFAAEQKNSSRKLDLIFEVVDNWLLNGEFDRPNGIFELLKEEFFRESLDQLELAIGFLTVTNGAQEHLEARQEFYEVFRDELEEREGEERAEALLGGLE